MSDKTGKSYELLVQLVFESILHQRDVRNVTVQRNVVLKGKHQNSHQIDICWKFSLGDVEYETVVQAKDWKDPVDQGELLKFKAVLEDLPGQPKGIFISRSGYQKGAKDFALDHGILIYELREADIPPSVQMPNNGWATFRVLRMPLSAFITSTEDPSTEKLYSMGWEWDVYWPEYTNMKLHPSTHWFASNYPGANIGDVYKIQLSAWPLNEQNLYSDSGAIVSTFLLFFRDLAQEIVKEGICQKRITHTFDQPTFVHISSSTFPRVKVDSVSLDIKVERKHEIRRVQMASFAQWVLHQLNSDKSDWFGIMPAAVGALLSGRSRP